MDANYITQNYSEDSNKNSEGKSYPLFDQCVFYSDQHSIQKMRPSDVTKYFNYILLPKIKVFSMIIFMPPRTIFSKICACEIDKHVFNSHRKLILPRNRKIFNY